MNCSGELTQRVLSPAHQKGLHCCNQMLEPGKPRVGNATVSTPSLRKNIILGTAAWVLLRLVPEAVGKAPQREEQHRSIQSPHVDRGPSSSERCRASPGQSLHAIRTSPAAPSTAEPTHPASLRTRGHVPGFESTESSFPPVLFALPQGSSAFPALHPLPLPRSRQRGAVSTLQA